MSFVRIAELEIDPAWLNDYTAALKTEIETSVRVEPGVLALHAVAETDDVARLRLFEIYADEASYEAHIGSAHFTAYKAATKDMVRALRLIDATPVLLSAKEARHIIAQGFPGASSAESGSEGARAMSEPSDAPVDPVDEAGLESFPASDPPAWTPEKPLAGLAPMPRPAEPSRPRKPRRRN